MLVSQRLLRSYQTKRQEMRSTTRKKDPEDYVLKAEHMGYRRFTPYGIQLDKDVLSQGSAKVR